MQPTTLYHGSLYRQTELMPGFKRSGKLTMWDGIESNQYLYTTTDKDAAKDLGVGSAVEKVFETDRYNVDGKIVTIWCKKPIPLAELHKLEIYVYTIPFRKEDGWVKNYNPQNRIETEWITKNTVRNVSVETVNMKDWLSDKMVVVTTAPTNVEPNKVIAQYQQQTQVYNQSGMTLP